MPDGVPIVEWTGELWYLARLSLKGRSRSESEFEKSDKLNAVDPKPGELAMSRLKSV